MTKDGKAVKSPVLVMFVKPRLSEGSQSRDLWNSMLGLETKSSPRIFAYFLDLFLKSL